MLLFSIRVRANQKFHSAVDQEVPKPTLDRDQCYYESIRPSTTRKITDR